MVSRVSLGLGEGNELGNSRSNLITLERQRHVRVSVQIHRAYKTNVDPDSARDLLMVYVNAVPAVLMHTLQHCKM